MNLRIGIVGLPNVGKSTVFNALTRTQNARVANYPFCTIEPNRAVVPVPDSRLYKLRELAGVPNAIPATIEFVDIAGLVRGASKGEGLGNQFLGQIRNTAAIVHVVRCFEDPNVVHVSEEPDPRDDIETIQVELALADMEQLERKIERLDGQAKADPKFRPLLSEAKGLREHLAAGKPISSYTHRESDELKALEKEMQFLTAKPVIYAANIGEESLSGENDCVWVVRSVANQEDARVVVVSAKMEEELAALSDEERREYLSLSGVETSALDQVIRAGYEELGLISFFTMNENEVRSWTVSQGATAPEAAGEIHTDFQRGFIRAEVIPYDVFVKHGSASAARAAGEMQLHGKDYIVQDGDVIYIRFNV